MPPSREDLTADAHRREIAALGGSARTAFIALGRPCVERFLDQNAESPWAGIVVEAFLGNIWDIVLEKGLPPPLQAGDEGSAGEMDPQVVAEMVSRVLPSLPPACRSGQASTLARQLLKACLQSEFRRCRESYCEVQEGSCRRQDLAKVKARLSGSHCVDCPYWVAFRPSVHARFLRRAWVGADTAEFQAYREVFLPEDFRALRIFLWRQARSESLP